MGERERQELQTAASRNFNEFPIFSTFPRLRLCPGSAFPAPGASRDGSGRSKLPLAKAELPPRFLGSRAASGSSGNSWSSVPGCAGAHPIHPIPGIAECGTEELPRNSRILLDAPQAQQSFSRLCPGKWLCPAPSPDPTWKWLFLLQDQNSAPSPSMSIPKVGRGQRKGIFPFFFPLKRSWELSPAPGDAAPAPSRRKTAFIGNIRGWKSEFHGLAAPSRGEKKTKNRDVAQMCGTAGAGFPQGLDSGNSSGIPGRRTGMNLPGKGGSASFSPNRDFWDSGQGLDVFQLFHLHTWVSISQELHPSCFPHGMKQLQPLKNLHPKKSMHHSSYLQSSFVLLSIFFFQKSWCFPRHSYKIFLFLFLFLSLLYKDLQLWE